MAEKQQIPPIHTKLIDSQGYINPEWWRWFQKLKIIDDTIRQTPDITYTTSQTLTTRHMGKTLLFNIGASNATCVLPSVGSNDVGSWVKIMRSGTGRLTITSVDSDRIEYSSAPGSIFCNEQKRYGANVVLQLMSETQWAIIGATGIWKIV